MPFRLAVNKLYLMLNIVWLKSLFGFFKRRSSNRGFLFCRTKRILFFQEENKKGNQLLKYKVNIL